MRRRNHVLLFVLAVVLMVTALPSLARGVHVTGNPEVQILAPQAGQTVSSLGVRLEISVTNFSLDGASIGGTNEANHGHYHVYVNDTFTGLLTAAPIVDVSAFPVGPMKLGVQLVNNDHTPLSPAVWHNVSVTVEAPSISFVQPANSGMVSTMGARFQVEVRGFELDTENYNGEPIPGHGHYHAFVDGSIVGTPTEPTFDVGSLTPGMHSIRVDLRTNNHQLLSPTVEALLVVTAVDPSISIVAPAEGAEVSTEGFQLDVSIAGWELDVENYNGNPIPGHGHYHVFVDGSLAGTPTTPTFMIGPLTAGAHSLSVDLRTNNHQLLSPTVEAIINVTAVAPSIAIRSPADGASVSTEGFQLEVAIAGWELDAENYNGNPIPGHGHYHVFVDGSLAGTPTNPSFAIGALAAGDHTVLVDLRTNNHQLLSPTAEASIMVTAVEPSISIVSPAADAVVSTEGFQLEVAIAGWELDAENYNGNPIPGHGHYHVFVDGNLVGTPTTPIFFIDALTAGSHTITVDLRTNNHQLLSPTVEASIAVTAAAPTPPPPAGVDAAVFVGTTVGLLVALVAVAIVLFLWGRGKGGGGSPPT